MTSPRRIAIAVLLLSVGLSGTSRADIYLVGAQIYSSVETGQNFGPYQYSTNSATTHFALPINGGDGLDISFLLSNGPNVFTFAPNPGQNVDPGQFAALNLYFNT